MVSDLSIACQIVLQLGMILEGWRISHLFPRYRRWTLVWMAFGGGFGSMLAWRGIALIRQMDYEPPWLIVLHHDLLPLLVNVGLFAGMVLLRRLLTWMPVRSVTRHELPNPAGINTDEQSFVTAWDANAEAMFGYTAQEAVGRPLTTLIMPERYRQPHLAGVARYLRERETRQLSITYEVKACAKGSDNEFAVVVRISVVPQPDGRVQFAGTIHRLSAS